MIFSVRYVIPLQINLKIIINLEIIINYFLYNLDGVINVLLIFGH
jgi:hypothetical protein